MKKVVPLIIMVLTLIVGSAINSRASGQDAKPAPKLLIGGGSAISLRIVVISGHY
ncbi:MAG: hypothetical protein HKN33_19300 [Pyrinomonadaceae bacterium]|nr:hypothetical protein [Pyrinomonadaceae bacterium]